MSTSLVVELLALGLNAVVGAYLVYAIFQMRRAYTEQRYRFVRAISAVEEFQKQQRETAEFLRHIESDGQALQKIALQVETAVASLNEGVSSSIMGAAERQAAILESLRDHLDQQEQRIATILEAFSETIRAIPAQREVSTETPRDNSNHSRLRRASLSQNAELRFSVLKEWVSINSLAILHRASRGWTTANELITTVPAYLEPEAEVLNEAVLLIGTRGHLEKLAVPLRELDSTSNFHQWFDSAAAGPAVLTRSNGHFSVVSKGAR
jgi:hypothetical protein